MEDIKQVYINLEPARPPILIQTSIEHAQPHLIGVNNSPLLTAPIKAFIKSGCRYLYIGNIPHGLLPCQAQLCVKIYCENSCGYCKTINM